MTIPFSQILVGVLLSVGAFGRSETFELATTVEKSDGSVVVDAYGYTKMNLLKMKVDYTGDITLTGAVSVEDGVANVVLWAKVDGKYYFSKMPGLQGFGKADPTSFAIPFSSPDSPITEIVLDVELPTGGTLHIKDLTLKKE